VEVDRDHESGGVVIESVRPAAKDLLGKDGHVVTKGRWLPPMVFSTLLVLAADTARKCLRPGAPAAAPVATARG
jgi:hypothetical protein